MANPANLNQTDLENFYSKRVQSPLVCLNDFFPEIHQRKGRVYLKADFLNHQLASGNKFWKLKYVLKHLIDNRHEGLISFGGPFSNHLYACSLACKELKIPFVAIVRGDYFKWKSYTIKMLERSGAEIVFTQIEQFRKYTSAIQDENLNHRWPGYFILPEGGNHPLLIPGIKDFVEDVKCQLGDKLPNTWMLAAGTGGSSIGLQHTLDYKNTIHVVNVLKNSSLLTDIPDWGKLADPRKKATLLIHSDYHFGGYAKTPKKLIEFINYFYSKSGIPLDPVYTSKLLYAFFDLSRSSTIDPSEDILIWHSGGIQGSIGFNEYHNENLPIDFVVQLEL